ncbi:MAG: Ldh family oxidoreductase [Betaproteobacteria bacterium]|nr:Ldh family oxidoreductase [Betaproteobacteria bacterium]
MTADSVTLSLDEVESLARDALTANGTSAVNALPVARSIRAAESAGIRSHGLARLATYCEHVRCGKVDGQAVPSLVRLAAASLRVDARTGFAHPAIEVRHTPLVEAARANGIAALAVTNSYNCGVVGDHVERLAEAGLVALAFVNSPPAIAPWGGKRALFGTNPIALAAPRRGHAPLVIDQSSSVIARGEIMLHDQQGRPIPEGWAIDSDGKPTTDAKAALQGGSLLPSGGYKGAGMALLVEIMAAGLTGANFSYAASSFANNEGGPPRTGQFFIAIAPGIFGGDDLPDRLEELFTQLLTEPGTRLPGQKRFAARERTAASGVSLPASLHTRLKGLLQVGR